jgi:hypothetical protein
MKGSLAGLGIAEQYTFDRPSAPPECKILNTFTGIKYVFGDPTRFKVIYEKLGSGSILMLDEIAKYVLRSLVHTNIPDVCPRHDSDKRFVYIKSFQL